MHFLRKKLIMGNKAPCRTRNLRKEIYTSSVLRNKFFEDRTKENEKLHKKQRNKCFGLKEYFHNRTENNLVTNKFRLDIYKVFPCKQGIIKEL